MSEEQRTPAIDVVESEPAPEYVPVESLSRRPRRRFVLPWDQRPDGVVRFIDSRDKSRFERMVRRGFIGFVWAISLLWFGGATAAVVFMGPGRPGFVFATFLSLGVTFAAAGEWMRRGGRPRTVEVDVHGRTRVSGPGSSRRERSRGQWRGASLELRPFRTHVDRDTVEGFTLLICDGEHRIMLCAEDSRDACIAALESMPAQVGSLTVHDSNRPIVGADLIMRRMLERMASSD